MIRRDQLWSVALALAFLCVMAWLLVPGDCVVRPAGSSGAVLRRALVGGYLHPFATDEGYFVNIFETLSPVVIVCLAVLHWRRRFDKLRALTRTLASAETVDEVKALLRP